MSSFIDKIIYINLDKRTDRRSEIENELNNFNLNYERLSAIEHNNGAIGCLLSHIDALKLAKKQNCKNVLILEDDFEFLISKDEFNKKLNEFINLNIDYDVLFFSYSLVDSEVLDFTSLIGKVKCSITSSGYLVNHKYFDVLIDTFNYAVPLFKKTGQHWNYAIDTVWKELQIIDNWYYFINRIGRQRKSYSDICKRVVEHNV